MATGPNQTWLKVLIGFILTLIVVLAGSGAKCLDKKVDKSYMEQHERFQDKQFGFIRDSLERIEGKK